MSNEPFVSAPWGFDTWTHVEVVPKPPPRHLHWTIGPVRAKLTQPSYRTDGRSPPTTESEITVQLTADQQVELSISGEDAYDNPVDISGDVVWTSSDESIVSVTADDTDNTKATAVAVGPTGTAAVTVSNDVNADGTGDFQGSIAIDVVAGNISEIVVQAAEPTDKA